MKLPREGSHEAFENLASASVADNFALSGDERTKIHSTIEVA